MTKRYYSARTNLAGHLDIGDYGKRSGMRNDICRNGTQCGDVYTEHDILSILCFEFLKMISVFVESLTQALLNYCFDFVESLPFV